jgi:hypothetical protein
MPKKYATAGPRSIYPTTATSLKIARCSIPAQLLFDRLIAAADDQGRLQGDPMLVKSSCMPLVDKATVKAMAGWLQEIEALHLIIRYEVDGEPLIQIRNWWDHQDGQRHIYPSRWPAPDGWDDRLRGHGSADSGGNGGPAAPDGPPEPEVRGAGARASAVPVPLPVPVPESAASGRPKRLTDAYKAPEHLTGEKPNAKGREMIDDLCRKFGRERLLDAMYRVEDTSPYGFLARAKDVILGKVRTA